MKASDYQQRGWVRFAAHEATFSWAKAALPFALQSVRDPANLGWLQCQGTWFVGVDALPNDQMGRVPGGPDLAGPAIDFITRNYELIPPLHRAQVSIVYPGYPLAREGEGEAALRYRRDRDAAHVDGIKLMADAKGRRRHLDEPHAWVLGLPLNSVGPDAAPMVVWEGSHKIMQDAFQTVFAGIKPQDWRIQDITDAYVAARRVVFDTCRRVTVTARPGEAYLIHRLALHGVAPWGSTATAPEGQGRIIAYFRPEVSDGLAGWLNTP